MQRHWLLALSLLLPACGTGPSTPTDSAEDVSSGPFDALGDAHAGDSRLDAGGVVDATDADAQPDEDEDSGDSQSPEDGAEATDGTVDDVAADDGDDAGALPDAASDSADDDGVDGGELEPFPGDPALEPSGPDWGESVAAIGAIDAPSGAPAQASVPSVGPTPFGADDLDPEYRVPLTRLFARWDPTATVDEVNAVLAEYDLQIGTAHPDLQGLTLIVPRFADREAGRALAATLRETGVFLWVDTTKQVRPLELPAPIVPQETYLASSHLVQTRTLAAWNVATLTQRYPGRIRVVVPDIYFDNAPDARVPNMEFIGSFVPDPVAQNGRYTGNHGFFVMNLLASSPHDAELRITGGVWDPLAEIRPLGLSANLLTHNDVLKAIGDTAPRTGHWVLNASIGYLDTTTTGSISDIERVTLATDWRRLIRTMPNVLVVAAAGNNGDDPTDRGAAYTSFFTTQALQADLAALYPPAVASGFMPDHLAALAREPYLATVQGSTLVVGASDILGARASFSTLGHDVLAPGSPVRSGCRVPDPARVGAIGECGADLEGQIAGTSFATPQVASAAAWLMSIAPELRVSTIRTVLLETLHDGQLDVFDATLALERFGPYAVRAALVDFDGDGSFSVADAADGRGVYRTAAIERPDPAAFPSRPDYSRYDLNGDGYARSDTARAFDLNADGLISTASYRVSSDATVPAVEVSESSVTDLNVLCYMAYTGAFSGSVAARDTILLDSCSDPFDVVGPHYDGTVTYRSSQAGVLGTVFRDSPPWWPRPPGAVTGVGFVIDEGVTTTDRNEEWTYRVRCAATAGGGAVNCRFLSVVGTLNSVTETLEVGFTDHPDTELSTDCAYGYQWAIESARAADRGTESILRALSRSSLQVASFAITFQVTLPGQLAECSLTATVVDYFDGTTLCGATDEVGDCGGPSFGATHAANAVPISRQASPPGSLQGVLFIDRARNETFEWDLAWFAD